MGMYTELNLDFDLMPHTSENTLNILRFMQGDDSYEAKIAYIPKHKFFDCHRWDYMLNCDSAYFNSGVKHSIAENDDESWHFSNVSNFKNYNHEIDLFVDWISPYVKRDNPYDKVHIGTSHYEEDRDPIDLFV